MKKNWTLKKYLFLYTVLFIVFALSAFSLFIMRGKSLIWKLDGQSQYLIYLAYIGRYMRNFFTDLFSAGGHRMFDLTIGAGYDVNEVFRTRLFNYLSVFAGASAAEVFYHVLSIMRMYLAGLAFSAYCRYMKLPSEGTLAGAMAYVFCGFTMRYGTEHLFFTSAMIILPLTLLAAEKLLRRENYLMMTVVVCASFITTYYFTYMVTLAMAVYMLLRFPHIYKENRGKEFLRSFGHICVYYLTGVAMAAVTLLPTVKQLGDSIRLADTAAQTTSLLRYKSTVRWFRWFLDLIAPGRGTSNATYLNYAVIVLPAAAVLFSGRLKKYLDAKLALLLEVLMLFVPAAGYVMSGFSGVTNRWVFILSFTLSLVCVLTWEDLKNPDRRQRIGILVVFGIYLLLTMYDMYRYTHIHARKILASALGLSELLIVTVLILLAARFSKLRKHMGICLLAATYVSCTISAVAISNNITDDFCDAGSSTHQIENSPQAALTDLDTDGVLRIDTNVTDYLENNENYGIYLGYQGVSVYNSLLNGSYAGWLREQENMGLNAIHRIEGLDGRTAAEALNGTGYFLTANDSLKDVPYGFELMEGTSEGDYSIWKNSMPLTFGSTTEKYISRSDYDKLSAAEKQQVLLEAALIEDEDLGLVTDAMTRVTEPGDEVLTEPVTLTPEDEFGKVKSYGYKIKQKGSALTVEYRHKAGYECYLQLTGFTTRHTVADVHITASGLDKTLTLRKLGATYSTGQTNYLIKLGYTEDDASETLRLEFAEKGKYNLEKAELVYVPMDNYEENIVSLNANALENLTEELNGFTGTIDVKAAQTVMVFRIPYSEGWSITVDGQKETLLRSDSAFCGVLLTSGEHEIRLTYVSPGSRTGLLVSLAGCLVFLILLCAGRSCRKPRIS